MKRDNTHTGGGTSFEGLSFRRPALQEPNNDAGGGADATKAKQAAEDDRALALISKAVEGAMTSLTKRIDDVARMVEKGTPSKATHHMGGVPTENEPAGGSNLNPVDVQDRDTPKGIGFVRFAKAGVLAKRTGASLASVLRSQGYEREARAAEKTEAQVVKALGTGTFAGGGALVPVEYSLDLITLLRNVTAVRSLGARTIPMGASMEIPEQTAAAAAYYVGENAAVTPSQPTFGGMRLNEKKMMALVPIGNDLLQQASIAAETLVRDDLLQVVGLKEDYQSIWGQGSAYSPRGIVNLTDTNNVYDATASNAKAPTLAEVRKEIAKFKAKMKKNNIPGLRYGSIMSPRTWEYLYGLVDGYGNQVFAAQLDAGTFAGAPTVVTNQIPENLANTAGTGSDWSRIIFGDFAQFVIGESLSLELEFFPNATYDSNGSGTIVSGVSSDISVIRAKMKHDFGMRYRSAFCSVAVEWGAP